MSQDISVSLHPVLNLQFKKSFIHYISRHCNFLYILDLQPICFLLIMRHNILITLSLAYFSASALANNPCKTTDKPQCIDNVGDNCGPAGWNPGQIICCTTNGYVYCNDTDYMQYADCPNNGPCRTDFKTCTQQCH